MKWKSKNKRNRGRRDLEVKEVLGGTKMIMNDLMDQMVLHEACLTCLLWIILVGITEMMVHKIQIEVSI